MGERRGPSGQDKSTDPIPREEKVRVVLGFYFGVPEQVVGSLAKQIGIDFKGKFTRNAFSKLRQAVGDWKDKPHDLGNNLNGGPDTSAGAQAQSSLYVADSPRAGGSTGSEVKASPTRERRGGRRSQPSVCLVPNQSGRVPPDRRVAKDKEEPAAPEGRMWPSDVPGFLGIQMGVEEIIETYRLPFEKGEDGRNSIPRAKVEEAKAKIDAEKNRTPEGDRCIHQWKLGPPVNGVVHQLCKSCGQETDVDTRETLSAYVAREQNSRLGF